MPSLNSLTTATSLNINDLLLVHQIGDGVDRKVAVNVLTAFGDANASPGQQLLNQIDAILASNPYPSTLMPIMGSQLNEGVSIPDANGVRFTKSFTIGKTLTRALLVVPLVLKTNNAYTLSFLSGQRVLHPSIGDMALVSLITQNLNTSRRFGGIVRGLAVSSEYDPVTGLVIAVDPYNKTYTDLGFLLGYFDYQSLKVPLGFPVTNLGGGGLTFCLESAVLEGNNIVFCFKKLGATTGMTLSSTDLMCWVETVV